MRGRATVVLLVVATALLALLAPGAGAAHAARYVVQLEAEPLASYGGGVGDLAATSPDVTGRPLARGAARVQAYRAHLARRQEAVLARVPGARPDVDYGYRFALAGFAAELSTEQREALERDPAVARVWRDELHTAQQASSPDPERVDALLDGRTGDSASYLGLPRGLWQRLGGVNRAGEGVIVGVIDTGITPEHPSFAGDPAAGFIGPAFRTPEVWDGACQGGEGFPTSACNGKLIGARYFVRGYGEQNLDPTAFASPRDDDGHGSHTAGTAAGNFGVDPRFQGSALGVDRISGIAPRAHVAAYKALWTGERGAGGFDSDLVAAIDAAVADGVDVINFSIGSATPELVGPWQVAFLGAADAGVFVSVSAGNEGPGAGTIGSASAPWFTSVGASSLARTFEATLRVTGGREADFEVRGGSSTRRLPGDARLVDGQAVAAPGVDAARARRCEEGSLDPARVRGAVVVCLRGGEAGRIAKSRIVREAGGVGMVLQNAAADEDQSAYPFWIPTVSVTLAEGERIRAAIDEDTRAAISGGTARPLERGGRLVRFSSRGPQLAAPDLLKPDLTAPGLNVLAAGTPTPADSYDVPPGELFQVISGTSMAAPHVAGAAALLHQLRPTLTPAELKSALVTTANPDVLLEDGTPAGPFAAGAGELAPNAAADAELVLDTPTIDHLRFLEGVDPALVAGDLPPLAATDLNEPSIAASEVPGTLATSRTFRSVAATARRWTVALEGLEGVDAAVTPRRATVRPGGTLTVDLDLTVAGAPLGTWVTGGLVLRSGPRTLRLPIAVRPVAFAVAETLEVDATAPAGTAPLPVQTGFAGPLSAVGWGLAAPSTRAETITATTRAPVLTGEDPGTDLEVVDVPEGAQLLAGETANVDGGAAGSDLDLYLFRDPDADGDLTDAELVAQQADADADERIVVPLPDAGRYVFAAVGYTTRAPRTTYDLTTWLVDDPQPDAPQPPPGLTVTGEPEAAELGGRYELTVGWSGVDAPGTYFGVATLHDTATPAVGNIRAATVVEVRR